MRHLNDFEKKIIQAMLIREKPDDVCVVNLINKVLSIYVIAWSPDYDVVSFVIHKSEDYDQTRNKLFDIITLLRFLDENQYIGIFPSKVNHGNMLYDHSKYEVKRFGEGLNVWFKLSYKNGENIDDIKMQNEVNGIGRYIEKYVNSTFHVTQELRDYVANGFRTDEEIRFQKERKIAIAGVVIAILTSLCSIIAPVLFPTNSSHQDFINSTLKNIEIHIDTLRLNFMDKDTIQDK